MSAIPSLPIVALTVIAVGLVILLIKIIQQEKKE